MTYPAPVSVRLTAAVTFAGESARGVELTLPADLTTGLRFEDESAARAWVRDAFAAVVAAADLSPWTLTNGHVAITHHEGDRDRLTFDILKDYGTD